MREGWCGDDYVILFDGDADRFHHDYGLATVLPGYRLLGLRSWDDFIVEDGRGARFTIPTVPADLTYIAPFVMPEGPALQPDDQVRGRIKWYVTPLVFGGDPNLGDNVTWITLDQHAKLVVWWNQKYRELRPRK
jgi:hypothetical protein